VTEPSPESVYLDRVLTLDPLGESEEILAMRREYLRARENARGPTSEPLPPRDQNRTSESREGGARRLPRQLEHRETNWEVAAPIVPPTPASEGVGVRISGWAIYIVIVIVVQLIRLFFTQPK